MDPQQKEFLALDTPPARLNAEQAGWYLGFEPHEITILVAARLLKPLGSPAPNGSKYFATTYLQSLLQDVRWLEKATLVISNFWKSKNRRHQKGSCEERLEEGSEPASAQ